MKTNRSFGCASLLLYREFLKKSTDFAEKLLSGGFDTLAVARYSTATEFPAQTAKPFVATLCEAQGADSIRSATQT
ncbi:MAG: hypothetical protein IJP61_01790 [Treponema sp.]|nr:hypothetical protein [Treponema sp.]